MPDPTRYEPGPRQTAAFDQNYAHISGQVDQLISTYRNIRAENKMPRSLDIAGVTGWLVEQSGLDRADLAELLTVAIVRLAEAEGPEPTRRTEQEGGSHMSPGWEARKPRPLDAS